MVISGSTITITIIQHHSTSDLFSPHCLFFILCSLFISNALLPLLNWHNHNHNLLIELLIFQQVVSFLIQFNSYRRDTRCVSYHNLLRSPVFAILNSFSLLSIKFSIFDNSSFNMCRSHMIIIINIIRSTFNSSTVQQPPRF